MQQYQNLRKENTTPTAYMPKYAVLDEIFGNYLNENQNVCLYFDTKNILFALHDPNEQKKIVHSFNSGLDKYIIARTVVIVANHWMRYFRKRNIGCSIFFFDERGNSVYHNSISKDYKAERKLSKQRIASDLLLGDDFNDKFYKAYDFNIQVVSGLFSRLNNLFFIKLKDLESDFIPKLLMNEYFTKDGILDPKYMHIIIGNDKDFSQLLTNNNVFQFLKSSATKTFDLRTKINALSKFTQIQFDDSHKLRNAEFIPLFLAVVGDKIDGIIGIKSVGYTTFYKYLNKLYTDNILTDDDYTIEKFFNKIEEYKKVNPQYMADTTTIKILSNKELIEANYKLTSFKSLIEWLQLTTKKKILDQLIKQPSNDEQRRSLLSNLCFNTSSYEYLI